MRLGGSLRSDPRVVSVGLVAQENGFRELGRFSGEYRRLFGELPSETLSKPGNPLGRNLPSLC